MAAVATANGQPTPPAALSPPPLSVQKRKYENPQTSSSGLRLQQTQRDLLQVLRPLDTTPSFLDFRLEDASDNEPAAKKLRPTESESRVSTLATRLEDGSYSTLEALKEDVARVGNALTQSLRGRAKIEGLSQSGRVPVDDLKQIHRITDYARMIDDFLSNETQHQTIDAYAGHAPKDEDNGSAALKSQLNEATTKRVATVLTLFGNGPTPKQLFSSMPNSSAVQGSKSIKPELPVDEMNLPNGLTATNILLANGEETSKAPTFEDTFAPPHSLPTLQPPRPYRPSTTRDGNLRWEFKDSVPRDSKKSGWSVQSQSVGHWLSYGEAGSRSTSVAPSEKRKQRDRALSSGENAQPLVDKLALDAALAKEEEALFRKAYASFAPSRDDTKAVISEESKSMLWWAKVGASKFADTYALDPALFDGEGIANFAPADAYPEIDDEEIFKAVEGFEDVVSDFDGPPKVLKADVDAVLGEISQRLETLASHQHIRNATLPANPSTRAPVSPGPPGAPASLPDVPSEDESRTCEALRHELAYLIMRLPPYALAKLDGEQLGELGVNALLTYKTKDTRGTLEEDRATRTAKFQASAAAAGVASLSRGSSSAGQHYNTTAQRTPAIGQAANTRYGQQYGAARTPISASQFQRPASGSTYGSSRPTYGQQTMYARPTAPQQSYAHPGPQQYYGQRPQAQAGYAGYQNYGQQYNQSMQGRPSYPSSQPLAQYQQSSQSQSAAHNAVSYQTNTANSQMATHNAGSPVKGGVPTPFGQPLQRNHQQPGSGGSTPNYPSQPQTPVNGQQPRPTVLPRPPSATPQTNGV